MEISTTEKNHFSKKQKITTTLRDCQSDTSLALVGSMNDSMKHKRNWLLVGKVLIAFNRSKWC